MPAIATVMAATSIAALRTGLFARWLVWPGLILATGGAVGTIGIAFAVILCFDLRGVPAKHLPQPAENQR